AHLQKSSDKFKRKGKAHDDSNCAQAVRPHLGREIDDQRADIVRSIRDKYAGIAAIPAVFLILSEEAFPDNVDLYNSPELHPQNDPCHWDARPRTNDKRLKELRKRPITDFSICENGIVRQISQTDVDAWP
ncbi:MAG: hypothetical protein P4M05_30365, partial [Bradyrhizobium sp.]|nr:hypothetical protein [Bradyrhizobium sp.]